MNNIILHIESNSINCNLVLKNDLLLGLGNDNNLELFNKSYKNNKVFGIINSKYSLKTNRSFFLKTKQSNFLLNCNKITKLKKKYILIIGNLKFKINQITSKLLIIQNIETKQLYNINNSISIGRNKNNNICIENNKISNIHANIVYKNNKFYIVDNKSVNGTYILPHKYTFKLDDKLKIGNIDIIVSKFPYGIYHDIGKRPTFEDTFKNISKISSKFKNHIISYFAIFDGHGGGETSKYCELYLHSEFEKLLNGENKLNISILKKCITKAIDNIDNIIFNNKIKSGTTANICILLDNKLICANVGDSRSILCRNNIAVPLSFDHKPTNKEEYDRIVNTNGFVKNKRLNGRLAVSRAIGDNMFKHLDKNKSPLISIPEINEFVLSNQDKYIVLACDGLWDVMSNQDVVNFINNKLKKRINLNLIAKQIVEYAIYNLHSSDNVTVFILNL
ncbi:FHA domain-containing protein [bacterium]|nr:FHA domain-containing protein [bacterium]